MNPPVILRVPFRGEHPAADVAGEILDARVSVPQVPRQALVHAKLFAAQVASVGTFSGVDPRVPVERVRRVEVLATFVAVVIYLSIHLHLSTHHQLSIDASKLLVFLTCEFWMRTPLSGSPTASSSCSCSRSTCKGAFRAFFFCSSGTISNSFYLRPLCFPPCFYRNLSICPRLYSAASMVLVLSLAFALHLATCRIKWHSLLKVR